MAVYNPYKEDNLRDLRAFCRNEAVEIGELKDANLKAKMLIEQYKAAIDVYLQNHIEYRQIQSQVTTILSVLGVTSFLLTYWTFNGFPVACIALIMIAIYAWYLRVPLTVSIYKNRHYHTYTAFVIRAIEDKFEVFNMPLRSKDYHKDLPYKELIGCFEGYYAKDGITSQKWQTMIKHLFWITPIFISFLALLCVTKFVFYICQHGGLWSVISNLFH
ncbi:MAG: hypothetical protein ABFD23_07790 [Caldisericales bacterium]|nr:hypothetical protein [bacterium]